MWGKNSSKIGTLVDLCPFPPLYRGIDSGSLERYAKSFSKKITKFSSKDVLFKLYKKTVEMTSRDENYQYSPIRLAVGVQFGNGDIEVVWQDKMVEYGTTTDPVARMLALLQLYRTRGIEPLFLIQADQFGVMHAPFAEGRANLYENDFKKLAIIIHDHKGKINYVNALDLSPEKFK